LPVGRTRRSQAQFFIVIPGRAKSANPESISPRGKVDSGQPLRGFRNDDDIDHSSADRNSRAFSRDGKRPSST
jgi:hypothetical protein